MNNPNEEAIDYNYSLGNHSNSIYEVMGVAYLFSSCYFKNRTEIREQLVAEWMVEQ